MKPTAWCIVAAMLASAGCSGESSRESAADAILAVRSCLAESPPDFETANDFLLAAMRIAPESQDVFATTLEFIELAAKDANAQDLAEDLYVRADSLIPFQPLNQIPHARRKHREGAQRFSVPSRNAREPFVDIQTTLTASEASALPSDLKIELLRHLREDLDAEAIMLAREHPQSFATYEASWREASIRIRTAEMTSSAQLFEGVATRQQEFMAHSRAVLDSCDSAEVDQLQEAGQRVVDCFNQGVVLREDLLPFVAAGVSGAKAQVEELQQRVELLSLTREWMHNQHALNVIHYLTKIEQGKSAPTESLRRLAQCDERHFTPYVLARYQQEWDRWFEQLQTDEQRVEAARARVLQGMH